MICFIKLSVADVRVIGEDSLLEILVMIDSSHAVHNNMRGYTGGITTFGTGGTGVIDQKSSMQRMNTRSATEVEHVETSEYLPKSIFIELFMNSQGYKPKLTLAKDNESEMRMLTNGKASCTSNDRIKNGNIKVKYCPTDKMITDFMSKPLQGSLFKRFRNVIMGWEHTSTLFNVSSSNEERVENNRNLPVEAKTSKLTYAEAVRASRAVCLQNELISDRQTDSRWRSTRTMQSICSLKRNNPVS